MIQGHLHQIGCLKTREDALTQVDELFLENEQSTLVSQSKQLDLQIGQNLILTDGEVKDVDNWLVGGYPCYLEAGIYKSQVRALSIMNYQTEEPVQTPTQGINLTKD